VEELDSHIEQIIFEKIYEAICEVSYIPKEVWYDLPKDFFSLKTLEAGEFFIKEDKPATHFAFVIEGVLKEYYLTKKGDEYVKAFNLKGDFTGSYFDLMSGLPSTCSIRAIKDTKLAIGSFKEFHRLYDTNIHWQKLGRVIAENLFIKKAKREYELLTLSAEERYLKLIEEWPDVEAELTQILIASYLGITPISLSRLKRMMKTKKLKLA